jgi:hypothetical protein
MVNSWNTISTSGRLRSCHITFTLPVNNSLPVQQANPLVYREMISTSTDPIGKTTALAKSDKSPCKGVTEE